MSLPHDMSIHLGEAGVFSCATDSIQMRCLYNSMTMLLAVQSYSHFIYTMFLLCFHNINSFLLGSLSRKEDLISYIQPSWTLPWSKALQTSFIVVQRFS